MVERDPRRDQVGEHQAFRSEKYLWDSKTGNKDKNPGSHLSSLKQGLSWSRADDPFKDLKVICWTCYTSVDSLVASMGKTPLGGSIRNVW